MTRTSAPLSPGRVGPPGRSAPASPRCRTCGKPIPGRVQRDQWGTAHPEHTHCAACGHEFYRGSVEVRKERVYHPECARTEFATKCTVCGQLLADRYLICYRTGEAYCTRHASERTPCRFCGSLSALVNTGPSSGACRACVARSIVTADRAREAAAPAYVWARARDLDFGPENAPLQLVGGNVLTTAARTYGVSSDLGITEYETDPPDAREPVARVRVVRVLVGLPQELFQGVLLHELGHAWILRHRIRVDAPWQAEGLCQYVALAFWVSLDTARSRVYLDRVEHDPNPTYGGGFRAIRSWIQGAGFRPFLAELARTRAFPSASPPSIPPS
jgi:hypothetical protein